MLISNNILPNQFHSLQSNSLITKGILQHFQGFLHKNFCHYYLYITVDKRLTPMRLLFSLFCLLHVGHIQ